MIHEAEVERLKTKLAPPMVGIQPAEEFQKPQAQTPKKQLQPYPFSISSNTGIQNPPMPMADMSLARKIPQEQVPRVELGIKQSGITPNPAQMKTLQGLGLYQPKPDVSYADSILNG